MPSALDVASVRPSGVKRALRIRWPWPRMPGPAGFLGPTPGVPALYDDALITGQAYVAGANRPDYHRVVTLDGGERVQWGGAGGG